MSSSIDTSLPATPPPPSPTPTRTIIYKVYGIANRVQAITAVGFTTFAVMHGLQIATGALRGVAAADSALLLTRPIYQDAHLEGWIVTGSVIWHLVAGTTKSILKPYLNITSTSGKTTTTTTPLLRYHDVTGQLLVPLLAGHYYLARGMPIKTMGDSAFVDFGIIAWGLQNKPVITWVWHTALIGVGVYHMAGGMQLALQRTFGGKVKKAEAGGKKGLVSKTQGVALGISTILIAGLVATSRMDKIPLRREYQDIYSQLLPAWLM
ncbi:hypothetical protein [Absidia glauca]|uniref:Mitochondrial adapter protein MCP1 transmembrane domain-containing protein n=1 Tax=Absidia glauca TaxID=4829 RepID=A0A163M2Z6_ABSGL|nr:hypothetical protein [Absidia glauca]